MDPHLNRYYHHHLHQQPQVLQTTPVFHPTVTSSEITTSASQVTNGGLLFNHGGGSADGSNVTALYPQSVAGKAPSPPLEVVRKKRGRPRKYATPEAAAAAKRSASATPSLSPQPLASKKRDQQIVRSSPSTSSSKTSKKSPFGSEASTGQSFTPHVISVEPGEDVAQKLRIFVQQSGRESCIISASGSVCNVSLLQPATSGGSISYDESFNILSLSGSFVRTDNGERTGVLRACLATSDGKIVGGGLAGPLIALGPVEVIVATFVFGSKKDATAGTKGDDTPTTTLASPTSAPVSTKGDTPTTTLASPTSAAASTKGDTPTTTLASPTSAPVSTMGYRPVVEQSGRYSIPAADDRQNIGGRPLLEQSGRYSIPGADDRQNIGGKPVVEQSGRYSIPGADDRLNIGGRPLVEQSGRYSIPGADDRQNSGGFMMNHERLHMGSSHSNWRPVPDARTGFSYDFTGRTGQGTHESSDDDDF